MVPFAFVTAATEALENIRQEGTPSNIVRVSRTLPVQTEPLSHFLIVTPQPTVPLRFAQDNRMQVGRQTRTQ